MVWKGFEGTRTGSWEEARVAEVEGVRWGGVRPLCGWSGRAFVILRLGNSQMTRDQSSIGMIRRVEEVSR